ncbi:hypothetical protein AGR6A_Lc150133 [Agrobacterium sp. NCPPB 925]|nr:hypothetical protein AGR6A_Lc150133 [Agrobacterium sp. NCPPB 925]
MQITEHHGKLLKRPCFGMGGAVAVHEDCGVPTGRQQGAQRRKCGRREAGDADVLRADTERYTDHTATSSVLAIYMHKLSLRGVIVCSPGLTSG